MSDRCRSTRSATKRRRWPTSSPRCTKRGRAGASSTCAHCRCRAAPASPSPRSPPALAEAGIGYVHLKALGTPKRGRDAAKKGDVATLTASVRRRSWRWRPRRRRQAAQMLGAGTRTMPSALLCYERDPSHCHRTLLLEAVGEGGGGRSLRLRLCRLPQPFHPPDARFAVDLRFGLDRLAQFVALFRGSRRSPGPTATPRSASTASGELQRAFERLGHGIGRAGA